MKNVCAALLLITFFSCRGKNELPDGIIEPKKMQRVFWDYLRADVFAKNFLSKDSTINDTTENVKLQDKVFAYYNISRENFYKSYYYYIDHPELMDVMLDSMIATQNRLKLNTQQRNSRNRFVRPKNNSKADK